MAGGTTTRSGIFGPSGFAQSCGTHTVPHLAASPLTVQAVSVVLGREDGEAGRGGLVPPQPAAVSAMAAMSGNSRGSAADRRAGIGNCS